jgi:surface antigen
MVGWRLLILMVMLGSLTACKTTPYNSQSIREPVVKGPNSGVGLFASAIGNAYVASVYGLDDVQKAQQNAAVYTALESDYGQVVSWYDRDSMGHVKAVHGYPQGRGYCKVIFSAVTVRGRTKQFEETACQNHYDSRGWKFVIK